jgi:hydrogenase/urease accessory protein HupE
MHRFFVLLIAAIAQPALAHPGEHHGNFYATLWHFLTEPDHLAFMAIMLIVGISSIVISRRRAQKIIQEQRHDPR